MIFTVLCLASCFSVSALAQNLPNKDILRYVVTPITPVQRDAAQLYLKESRANVEDFRLRNIVNAALVMFLFGAFCAIWAQNTRRNPWLWFLYGFLFTLLTVLIILRANPKTRRKKRYRRSPDYWNLAHY